MIPERFSKLHDDYQLFKKQGEANELLSADGPTEPRPASCVGSGATGSAAERAFDSVRRDVAERLRILEEADDGHPMNYLQTDELRFVLKLFDDEARWHSLPNANCPDTGEAR